ncbi:ribosomal-protein-alanine N-acetyltransferase [Legionella massiliensis]|uniref:Ribosomal-protein-alanine N-acetyltransferase n=1 Tax=Legionella massiliensis TaxID=1034943 RepID=A0A078L197_9GAMM|nr:GNAT family N-acetyltransferase [Legionella massiliensis]CDZ78951.1 ribosomal-protein-alanine N-acetyltransferase [Legionella massiliensis]CEE14689.1 ribosomal-protein-alanine N-acetyltransferase [Legionella massiliensis]
MDNLNHLIILESKNEVSFSEINELSERVGWGKNFYPTKEQWELTLKLSTHIAYIKKNAQLICFGRVVGDGQMCMFYDICVHPEYQKQYIGSLLMNHLINKVKDKNYASIGLFVWQGNSTASEFYRKFGFEVSPAMELREYMRSI